MASPGLEEFARKLVQAVRDRALRSCDLNLRPEAAAVPAKRWREAGVTGGSGAANVIVPDAIDEALFFLLNAIDQGILRLRYVAEDGSEVDLSEDGLGELAGWYVGPDGWRRQYSSERYFEFVE
jgi:hypothetical protein